MKCKYNCVFNKSLFFLILFFLILTSASVSHAENYKFVAKWGSNGTENGSFASPFGVAVDSSGKVYVADLYNNRIQKFDNNGSFVTTWGSNGTENGSFASPFGVAVDSSRNVYVADTENSRIQKFDNNGSFITKWGSYGNGNGSFVFPVSVAVDSSGNVYVADTYNHRIQKFDNNGSFITTCGSNGTENGSFYHPYGVAVDSSGNVYVTDTENSRIQKFDNNGSFITTWGFNGTENGSIASPFGVAVDSSGNVYVTDYDNSQIQKFDNNGSFITKWGSYGTGNGSFVFPGGVALDSSGNVYVADTVNQRIQKFALFPTANFSTNVTSGVLPLSVQFNDSSEDTTEWQWDFGDGNNSTEQNTTHTYSMAATYTVNLTARNGNGTDSKLSTITVLEPILPIANFNTNVTSGVVPLTVQFNDSSENATDWSWNFGDGNTSNQTNPVHTYLTEGNYTINLTASNGNGSSSHLAIINVLNASYSIFMSVIGPDKSGDCIINSPGDKIPYRIVVKNEGNIDLTNVTVNDTLIPLPGPTGDNNSDGVLNPGETWLYDAIYILTSNDVSNGYVNNTATVRCDQLPERSSSVNTPIDRNADLSIYKSVTGIDESVDHIIDDVGDIIQYQVAVKNNGNIDLTGVEINDPMVNLTKRSGDGSDLHILGPGETWVYAGNYSVTQKDIDSAKEGVRVIENTATVSCDQLSNESSSLELPIIYVPSIVVTPEPENSTFYPIANFSTNATSGYAPLSVQFTDSSTGSPTSWSWDFNNDGNAESKETNPVYTYNSPGTYTVNLTVSNVNGTDSKNTTINVLEENGSSGGSSSGSSSSGGSGGSGSTEPASNVEAKEISQAFISSGKTVRFDFPKNVTPVLYLSFDSKKTFGKTSTIVEMLKGKSTLVSGLPSDEVYKFVNIWIGDGRFVTSNIENAVVCFKVEKSWVQDKKIDQSSIALNRYSDNKWEQLQTSKSGEDETYLYFTAKTLGFSPFAITGKTTATGTEIQSGTSAQNSEQNNGNTGANAEQTSEQKNNTSTPAKESKKTPGFEIICGITGLLAVYLYRRRK